MVSAQKDVDLLALPPGGTAAVEPVGTYGNVTTTTRDSNGKLQSVNGQPSEVKMSSKGTFPKRRMWHDKGKLHSFADDPLEESPSVIEFDVKGLARRRWHDHGVAGRPSDGLMIEEYSANGGVTSRTWRADGPGLTRKETHMAGGAIIKRYEKRGALHRLDGPAQVFHPGDAGVPPSAWQQDRWAVDGRMVPEHVVTGVRLGIDLDNAPAMDALGESDWRNMTAGDDRLTLIMTLFPNS